jgi:hypothetical protein
MAETKIPAGTIVKVDSGYHWLYDCDYPYKTATWYDAADGMFKQTSILLGDDADRVEDATDEVKALYKAHVAKMAQQARDLKAQKDAEDALYRAKMEAAKIEKGDYVTVYKGRKVPKGTIGQVFWIGDTQYGTRIGLTDAAGDTWWTALTNVKKMAVAPESAVRLIKEVRAEQKSEWLAKKKQTA